MYLLLDRHSLMNQFKKIKGGNVVTWTVPDQVTRKKEIMKRKLRYPTASRNNTSSPIFSTGMKLYWMFLPKRAKIFIRWLFLFNNFQSNYTLLNFRPRRKKSGGKSIEDYVSSKLSINFYQFKRGEMNWVDRQHLQISGWDKNSKKVEIK